MRNFQDELKTANSKVKTLGAQRDKLIGDARVEESKVAQTVEQLKALGIEGADKLTVEELKALREKSQAEMEASLDVLQVQIKQAEVVMAEYEAVA